MRVMEWLGVEAGRVSLLEKLVATLGEVIAIFAVFLFSRMVLPPTAVAGVIGSMGATAVLLFAVPHGPLSQPWALLGGHLISAFIGVTCAVMISDLALATSLAVGVAIRAMYQFKCIHPPGGATAFIAVMGGEAIRDLGYVYVLCPVLLNAGVMFALAVIVNYPFSWRRYPAAWIQRKSQKSVTTTNQTVSHDEIVRAVQSLDSFVDVSEDDLIYLIETVRSRVDVKRQIVQTSDSGKRWLQPENQQDTRRYSGIEN